MAGVSGREPETRRMSLRNRQEFVRATRGMFYYLFDARSAHTEIFGQLASWAEAGWTIYVRSPTIDKDCLRELIHCTAQSDVRLCARRGRQMKHQSHLCGSGASR